MIEVLIDYPCGAWDCGNDTLKLETEHEQIVDEDYSFRAYEGDVATCPECGTEHVAKVNGDWVEFYAEEEA